MNSPDPKPEDAVTDLYALRLITKREDAMITKIFWQMTFVSFVSFVAS